MKLLAPLAVCLLSGSLHAQICPTLSDLNPNATGTTSKPDSGIDFDMLTDTTSLTVAGGKCFFTAQLAIGGDRLYVTDGTPAGTIALVDTHPTTSDHIHRLIAVGNSVYFYANAPDSSLELWTSDGTVNGTHIVSDIYAGSGSSFVSGSPMVLFQNKLLFAATTQFHGSELWVHDVGLSSTYMLKDILPGAASSVPKGLTASSDQSQVFFAAKTSESGNEPWVTDGTVAGTHLVLDINPGTASSKPQGFKNLNGRALFIAWSPGNGRELWSTDGTPTGTTLLRDIAPGSGSPNIYLSDSAVLGNELYFAATTPTTGREIWKTDGTAAGTVLCQDFTAGPAGSHPLNFFTIGSQLFFAARGPLGRELYKIPLGGTITLVKDIAVGTDNALEDGALQWFTEVAGKLYFYATSDGEGSELWESDGTPGGTQLLKDIEPGTGSSDPKWLTKFGGSSLLFFAHSKTYGREIWKSDLTTASTQLLKDLNPEQFGVGSKPGNLFTPDGSRVLFSADVPGAGNELMIIDPIAGPVLLKDLSPGPSGQSSGWHFNFFSAWDGTQAFTLFVKPNNRSLWRTDGTRVGTTPVKEGKISSPFQDPRGFVSFAGKTYFTAHSGNFDIFGEPTLELWSTDGTESGTQIEVDLQALSNATFTSEMVVYKDRLYFIANTQATGAEVWSTDGTAAGTSILLDIAPGSLHSVFHDSFGEEIPFFYEFNGLLFFAAADPQHSRELWVTDGTSQGTHIVKDIAPGTQDAVPTEITPFKDKLLFVAGKSPSNRALYSTDGTAAGTLRLTDPNGLFSPTKFRDFVVLGDNVYFAGFTSWQGWELWRTDGTAAGTSQLIDLQPGIAGSSPYLLLKAGDGIYFRAETTAHGPELWLTDGTAAGTHMVCDLAPGPDSSFPTNLLLADGKLFFSAITQSAGAELFSIPVAAPYVQPMGSSGSGSSLMASTPQMGATMTISAANVETGTYSLLVASAPTGGPTSFLTAPNSASWIDPNSASLLGLFSTTDWSMNIYIPLTPSLVGVQVNMQNFILPGATFPAETSNALSVVLGY